MDDISTADLIEAALLRHGDYIGFTWCGIPVNQIPGSIAIGKQSINCPKCLFGNLRERFKYIR